MQTIRQGRTAVFTVLAAIGLAACGTPGGIADTVDCPQDRHCPDINDPDRETIFAGPLLNQFGFADSQEASGGELGVNAMLWRASLDTLAFMTPSQVDPVGGVIIYDWYSPPQSPDERFKVVVYVLDTKLRANGITVTLAHQLRDDQGRWVEQIIDPTTITALEDAILTRARQFRIAYLGQ